MSELKPCSGSLYLNIKTLEVKELKTWVSGEPHFEEYRYDFTDGTYAHKDVFFSDFTHIAELEGLDVDDKVWCISSDGETEYYTIESVFSNNMGVYCGRGYISLNLNGSPCLFGNGKQLFYRTEDRAERFGKGGEA